MRITKDEVYKKVAERHGISEEEAKKFMDEFAKVWEEVCKIYETEKPRNNRN